MLPVGRKRNEIEGWVEDVERRFAGRILPFTSDEARVWGRLYGEAQRAGHPPPLLDSLLAATALMHDLTLVTRNTADFAQTEMRVFDPLTMRKRIFRRPT